MPSLSRRRRASKGWALALSVFFLLTGAALPASAAETAASEIVIIRPEDVVTEDLYAGAIRVLVEGEVQGDLVVAAAEEVVIEGTVTGSVTALAPTVRVNGVVGGSLRVAAGEIRLGGEVAGDLVLAGARAHLDPGSRVGGDVLVWTSALTSAGEIGGDLGGSQGRLRLAGAIGGDVDVSVENMVVTGPLTVTGDLGYRSSREAEGLDQVEAGGSVVHRRPLPPNIRVRALGLFARLMAVLVLSIIALLVAYMWPRRVEAALGAVTAAPVRCWLIGAAILFSPLVAGALVVVVVVLAPPASAVTLGLVSLPVLAGLLGLAMAVSVLAGVPAVGRLGALLWRNADVYGAVLAGSVVAGLVWLIPVVGWLVPLLVLPLGLGGWLRSGTASAVSEAAA
jgi:cytoskeletal protein CcmA (bactofilin family)